MNMFRKQYNSIFNTGHERSNKAKKNIVASFLVRGTSLLTSFLLVPIVLHYVNPTKYGIWLTISSVIAWFGFFDISLGEGLRNKLSEALAHHDNTLAKTYVSTAYALIVIIFSSVMLLFVFGYRFVNWAKIFNAPADIQHELSKVVLYVFVFFCLRFILQLINSVIYAKQKPALVSLYNFIWHLLSLVIIFLITKTTHDSLLYIAIAYSITPIIVLGVATVYLFNKSYRDLAPSLKSVDFKYMKSLLSLGSLFFINRVSMVILYSTDNLIITQISGPQSVTPYAISHKYFYLVLMGFEMLTLPFWSAFTEAYIKKEFNWIKNIVKKITRIWKYALLVLVIMLAISGFVYKIWIGDSVHIPFALSSLMAVFVMIKTWTNIFSRFLSGVSKIRLATYICIAQGIINIPLSILLAKNFNMGINGVILATIICVLPTIFTHPIQYKKIITQTAKGIWNK